MLNIGITGGNGFFGSHIKKEFQKKTGVKVYVFDRPENDLLIANDVKKFAQGKDVIIHAGAINRGTNTEIISVNVTGTYNLLNACKNMRKKPKVIFISSIQAETETLYGQTKKMGELMCEEYAKENDGSVLALRFTNLFGEGGRPFYNSVIATFCFNAKNGAELRINDKKKKISFLYVGDAAKIIAKEALSKKRAKFTLLTIKGEPPVSLEYIAEKIRLFASKRCVAKNVFEKKLLKTYNSYK